MSEPIPLELAVEYQCLNDNESLQAACDLWRQCPYLAVDTEFIRTDTYYPKVGLIQVSDGKQVWLIDPLEIDRWETFSALMTAGDVCKIFHSCSEDLLVFIAFLDVMPTPVFDTQVAAAFLNMGLSLSLQNLVLEHSGIALPKGETRSDWLQRPLTPEQLDYAALDVIYLPEIAAAQRQKLEAVGRLSWVEEECERCLESYETEFSRNFDDHYLGLKNGWKLSGAQLHALQALAAWRETRARERNKPRNWILRDQQLYDIAGQLPTSRQALAQVEGINPNFIRYEGDRVIALVEQANAQAGRELKSIPRPLSQGQKKRLKRAKDVIINQAENLGLPVELLGRRKALVELLQNVQDARPEEEGWRSRLQLPAEWQGWRGQCLEEDVLEAMAGNE